MINDIQEEQILKRVSKTIELFFENNGMISDVDLAKLVTLSGITTSSSTVGRDLISLRALGLIGEEKMELIKSLREKHKEEGRRKGGKQSIYNNDVLRDSEGRFMGSVKRNG